MYECEVESWLRACLHTNPPSIDQKNINEHALLQERESLARRQMLEEERRRREEAEKRLQDETFHRQMLVEKEVKMRAKNFSQVSKMRRNRVCMVERCSVTSPGLKTWLGFTCGSWLYGFSGLVLLLYYFYY